MTSPALGITCWFSAGTSRGLNVRTASGKSSMISGPANIACVASILTGVVSASQIMRELWGASVSLSAANAVGPPSNSKYRPYVIDQISLGVVEELNQSTYT